MTASARRAAGRSADKRRAVTGNAEGEVARRVARCLARCAAGLGWKAAEVAAWEARARTALADPPARARGTARQMQALAKRLRRAADAREALRVAALLRVRTDRARAAGAGQVLSSLLAAVRPALSFDQATAFVCDADGGRLVPAVVEGSHVDLIPDITFDHGAGFSSWVAKSRRPVLLSTRREDCDSAGTGRPASFLSVPLVAGEELVGVLNLAHRRPGAFTAADRDFVVLAGGLAAAALPRFRRPAPAG